MQSGAGTATWGNFTQKGSRYCKVGQLLQSRAVHTAKVHQGVGLKLLSSPISLIFLLGTKANGVICLHIGPKWFEARAVYYVEMAFSRDRSF